MENNYYKIALFLILGIMASRVSAQQSQQPKSPHAIIRYGGLERADTTLKHIHMVFTGGDYYEGGQLVKRILKREKVLAHFFFTGDFYRNPKTQRLIKQLKSQGHYLGPHSDKHLLYASWENRDSLLVSKEEFRSDLLNNYEAMASFGIEIEAATLFMPPYEWYNQKISDWTEELGLRLINFTPGTRSNADYTTPDMGTKYITSADIYQRILDYEQSSSNGLNGFILLIHIGTHPDRIDKFYYKLPQLIEEFRKRGYRFTLLSA